MNGEPELMTLHACAAPRVPGFGPWGGNRHLRVSTSFDSAMASRRELLNLFLEFREQIQCFQGGQMIQIHLT